MKDLHACVRFLSKISSELAISVHTFQRLKVSMDRLVRVFTELIISSKSYAIVSLCNCMRVKSVCNCKLMQCSAHVVLT